MLENNIFQESWSTEEQELWKKLLPYIKFAIEMTAIQENSTESPNIISDICNDFSDAFKKNINKLFRNTFGNDCKIPHPEVDN